MARLTVQTDTSDATAIVKVICDAVSAWSEARRLAFTAEFDRLVAADRLVATHIAGPGLIEVDASPDLLALARRYGIGEVMA